MTRRWMAVLTLVIASTTLTGAQQRDVRPTAPATTATPPMPTGTASLAGQVVADVGDAPIAHATVVLIGARTGVMQVTSSDLEGRFIFTALPADRYTVGASKLPYIGAVAGARRPARAGSPVVLADAAQVGDITVRLPKGATISGTVFDANGAPIAGVVVAIMQRRMQNGEVVIAGVPGSNVIADDRGAFRFHGLVPGEYLISAMPLGSTSSSRRLTDNEVDDVLAGRVAPEPTAQSAVVRNAPSYYPGTSRLSDAVAITVAAGDDRQQVDFRLEVATLARIEGTVAMADGSTIPRTTVMMTTVAGSSPLSSGASITTGADGRFGISGQPPGRYLLSARAQDAAGPLVAAAVVDTAGSDVASTHLVLRPGVTLNGRYVAAPSTAKPPSLAGQRLQITGLSAAARSGTISQGSPSAADGTFTITGLMPERYLIGGAPFFGNSQDSVTWGLASVVLDGIDITDKAVAIDADNPPKDVIATITDQWQDISGRVARADGSGVSDFTVLVFPVDESYWLYQSRRHVTAQPDSTGAYRLGGPGPALLPAGEYHLALVTDITRDEQYDPAFLRTLVPAALKISLAPGQRLVQDVGVSFQ